MFNELSKYHYDTSLKGLIKNKLIKSNKMYRHYGSPNSRVNLSRVGAGECDLT